MLINKIPLSYNLRSIRARYTSTMVAILGIAGVVAVFLAMLALANGFRNAMVTSGSSDNAIVLRSGSGSEIDSWIPLDAYKIIRDSEEIALEKNGNARATGEVALIGLLKMRATGTDANVQMRGFNGDPFRVRDNIDIIEGRLFEPGKAELAVGAIAARLYQNTEVGSIIPIGGRDWIVVGIFDTGGSSFDSELWTDSVLLNETFDRPTNVVNSVKVELNPGVDLEAFSNRLAEDPRINVFAQSEVGYYSEKSQMMSALITTLGLLIVMVMGVGAVFAALNTMFAIVAARYREIATLRSLGFSRLNIVISFVFESVLISIIGGILGCILVLPLNGYQAATMNWDTFSHLGFSLKLTPVMMISGIVFAVFMGFLGGLIPATHAARKSIVNTLRGL